MKKVIWSILIVSLCVIPSLSFAKGMPLFFQTGDELFEIEGAPVLDEGYKIGYACKRFGLLGADVWTWDCDIKAINIEEFSAGDIEPELKTEMESKFSLGDRVRNPWNHYGILGLALLMVGGIAIKARG